MITNKQLQIVITYGVMAFLAACSADQNAGGSDGEPRSPAAQEEVVGARVPMDSKTLIPPPADLHAGLAATPLILENDRVVLDKQLAAPGDEMKYAEQLAIANKALEYVRGGDLHLSKRVAVFQQEDKDIVVFDINLPPDTLGGDYSYSVAMKKGSGELINVLVP